jgi:TRAP-type mannitol/chloroaromatic compound transport system permease small subunit
MECAKLSSFFGVIRIIDTISDWSGRVFSWLIFPLIGALAYEVFARYLFNAPTVWAYDVTYMLYGGIFMLGAGYTLYRKGHIRTDMLYHRFPVRWQGIIDASMYLFLFFPGMLFFLIVGGEYAYDSWMMRERSSISPWRPPIYPFKAVIPLTAFSLLIQGVSEFLKSIYAAFRSEWP